MEKFDPAEFEQQVAEHGRLMSDRFQQWLESHGMSMRQFAADTGIHYHRIMRISKTQQMGYDIVLAILKMDPLVSPRWLLGLDNENQPLYYKPSPVGSLSAEALKNQLATAEHTIFILQERIYQLLNKEEPDHSQSLVTALKGMTTEIVNATTGKSSDKK